MEGINASNIRRIYLGLLANIIAVAGMTVAFFVIATVLDRQMISAGLNTDNISGATIARFPGIMTKLLYAVMILRYCASALCSILVISGLDELRKCSQSYVQARYLFLALIFGSAFSMIVHIYSATIYGDSAFEQAGGFRVFLEAALFIVRGVALAELLKGDMDVLNCIGATLEVERIRNLCFITPILFLALGIARVADHFAPEMSMLSTIIFAVIVFAFIICDIIIYIRIIIISGKLAETIASIS